MSRPPSRSSHGRKLTGPGALKVILGGKDEKEKPTGWLNRIATA